MPCLQHRIVTHSWKKLFDRFRRETKKVTLCFVSGVGALLGALRHWTLQFIKFCLWRGGLTQNLGRCHNTWDISRSSPHPPELEFFLFLCTTQTRSNGRARGINKCASSHFRVRPHTTAWLATGDTEQTHQACWMIALNCLASS